MGGDCQPLCFGLGENDEGLKALRRAAQLDGADPQAAITLAEAFARQFRTDEAIEIYWQAFDKATELDGKVGVVAQLAPLYLQQNAFDRLLARLERSFGLHAAGGDAEAAPREKAACLAQAYASSGDFAAARSQLEGLLAADSRGAVKMGAGTLYGSLKRMLDAGLVQESERRIDPEMDDERRIYYRITGAGRAALAAELERYRQVVALAQGRNVSPAAAADAA